MAFKSREFRRKYFYSFLSRHVRKLGLPVFRYYFLYNIHKYYIFVINPKCPTAKKKVNYNNFNLIGISSFVQVTEGKIVNHIHDSYVIR